MRISHPMQCSCGAVTGALHDPRWVHRVICYCNSCQAFAERLGRGADVLDAEGGSDILQAAPRSLTVTQGPKQHISVPAMAAFLWHMAMARLDGSYKVTPFFDGSGAPVAAPADGPVLERP